VRPYSPDSPWDLDPSIAFLNHGSYGACPRPVLEAQRALVAYLESDPVRFLSREFEARLDAARESVAAFLGADPAGLVVVPNATTGVATVLASLRLRPGDELLTTDHEYNATLNAITSVAERARARVVRSEIPLPIRHPEQAVEAILAAVTPRTRIALVSHITSPTGLVLPIDTIVRELDRLGVDTLVDAAHAPGMVPIDLRALGAAYWTGNGHKWLCGPKGAGMLYVREDRRDGVLPLVTSHGRNDPRGDRPTLWKEFDWQGTGDPTAFLSLPESIRVIGGLQPGGWPAHMAANRALALWARDRLSEALGLEPLAPDSMIGSMAAIAMPAMRDDLSSEALAETDGVEVPIGGWPVRAARDDPDGPPKKVLLRISAQRYNEPSDIERLIEALVRRGLSAGGSRGASAIVAG
jgi:isopenicillin-N epimerase